MLDASRYKQWVWACYFYAFVYTVVMQGLGYRLETWRTLRRFYFKELHGVFTIRLLLRPIVFVVDLFLNMSGLDSPSPTALSPSRAIMYTFLESMALGAFFYAILDQLRSFTFESYEDRIARLLTSIAVVVASRAAMTLWTSGGAGEVADAFWHVASVLPYMAWRALGMPKGALWAFEIFAQHGASHLLPRAIGSRSMLGSAMAHALIGTYAYAFLTR